jgi:hypothetical protein
LFSPICPANGSTRCTGGGRRRLSCAIWIRARARPMASRRQRLKLVFGLHLLHAVFVFNQLDDVEQCALRAGNVHSADGWRVVLEPVIAGYRDTVKRRQPRDLRAPRSPAHGLCNPAAGQRHLARAGSDTCSSARLGDRRMSCAATSPASVIRRRPEEAEPCHGQGRVASGASCTRASASSSPTWHSGRARRRFQQPARHG